MRLLFTNIRPGRAHGTPTRGSDDALGRGMDVALTLLVFMGIGWLVDRWLGLFPVFTISFVLFAAVGSFLRMKFVYDATMERLESERRSSRAASPAGGPTRLEDAA